MATEIATPHDARLDHAFPRLPWWVLLVVAVLGLGIAGGGFWLHQELVSEVRDDLLPTWSRDYDSSVTVDRLSVWVFPSIQVTGDGLTFRLHGRESEPPLLHVAGSRRPQAFSKFFTSPTICTCSICGVSN